MIEMDDVDGSVRVGESVFWYNWVVWQSATYSFLNPFFIVYNQQSISRKMKTANVILLSLMLFSLVKAQTDIDLVLDMLNGLRTDTHDALAGLDTQWEQTQQVKDANINGLKETKQEQIGECQRQDQSIRDKQVEIWRVTDFIAWIKNRQEANLERIQVLEDLRCEQAQNFIDTVRDNKIELTVAQFLRNQIQRITDGNTSYVQKSEALKQITTFLQKLNDSTYEILAMQKDAENELDDRITSLLELHDAESMPPMEYKKFAEERDQVLISLNEIEEHIRENIPRGQNNMIVAGLTFVAWKEQLLKENQLFNDHLKQAEEQLDFLQEQQITMQFDLVRCRSRIQEIDASVTMAFEDIKQSMAAYMQNRDKLLEQLQFYVEIWNFYDKKVHDQTSSDYREHVQDKIEGESELQISQISGDLEIVTEKPESAPSSSSKLEDIIDPNHEQQQEPQQEEQQQQTQQEQVIENQVEEQIQKEYVAPRESEFADENGEVSADFILGQLDQQVDNIAEDDEDELVL